MIRSLESVARTWGWCAMSDELKPCPFCGSESAPHVTDCIETMVCHNIAECEDETLFWVTCSVLRGGCGAEAGYVRNRADAVAAWNSRAAVTDEQFSLAVRDGRVWQKVRTCHMSMCDEDDDDLPAYYRSYKCDACGKTHARYKGDDYDYCPRCGAKVMAE